MKRLKKIVKYLGVTILLLVLFRGVLYRATVNYSKVGIRDNVVLTNNNLIEEINIHMDNKTLDIEDIIALSNKLTSEKLKFTFEKTPSDPNLIPELKKANCIGYSSLFNAIGNYIIKQQNQTDDYEFVHLVGEINVLGLNVHSLFNDPFFKDHDFNEVIYKKTGERIYIDPSLRDYLRIDRVNFK